MRRRLLTVFLGALVLAVAVAGAAAGGQRGGGLGLVRILDGLDAPVQVTAPSGSSGVLYVVEQGGLVRVVKGGRLQPEPFLDVRSLTRAGGEQGLLGLAFAPDYAKSGLFVVDYTDTDGNTRVVRYRSSGSVAVPGSCSSWRSRMRITTVAWSPSAGTACSTSGWGTAARAATRATGRRAPAHGSGRSSG